MAHEQSETVQLPNGQWVNIYGQRTPQAGQRIPDMPSFRDMDSAVQAARARSSESRGSPDDLDTMRMVYELMSNQEAAAQRGAGPSYRREYRLPGIADSKDWEPSLDWQDRYSTEPYPRTRPIRDINAAPPTFTPSTTPTRNVPGGWVRGALPDAQFLADLVKNLPHAGLGVVAQLLGMPADLIQLASSIRPEEFREKRSVMDTEPEPSKPLTTEWLLEKMGEEHPSAKIASMVPMTGPSGTVKEVPALLSILAGVGAKGGPWGKLKARQDYALKQATTNQPYNKQLAWREFGVELGSEGKPRWEISDVPAAIDPQIARDFLSVVGPEQIIRTLPEIIQHPELYKAYPQLTEAVVSLRRDPSNLASGSYSIGAGVPEIELSVNPRAPDALRQLLEVALHEVQHGVQRIERFPRGGSASTVLNDLTPDEMQILIQSMLKQPRYRGLRPEQFEKTGQMNALAGEAYSRLAGEVEARNVQSRWFDPSLMQWAPSITEDVPRGLQIKRYR